MGKILLFVFQLPIEITAWLIMVISSKTVGDLVLEGAAPSLKYNKAASHEELLFCLFLG